MDDGAMPSNTLRNLEVEANKAFDQYREMYFEGELCILSSDTHMFERFTETL